MNFVTAVVVAFVLLTGGATAQLNEWLATVVTPIREKDLLDVKARWSELRTVDDDSLRLALCTSAGYADSTGAIAPGIKVRWLTETSDSSSGRNITFVLYWITGVDAERDESLWIFVNDGGSILGRTSVGTIRTTCSETFLSGCSTVGEGVLAMQQLEHHFDCESDAFLNTETLDPYRIRITADGNIEVFE